MVINLQIYCCYIGTKGWNSHTRNFIRNLDREIFNIKVSNYSVDDSFELDSLDKELLHEQILWSGDKLVKEPCDNYEEWFVPDINLVFAEANHYLYYQDWYDKDLPLLAYTVTESTKLHETFFEKLKEFDEVYVPTKWQKECHVEQGYYHHKIKVIPEGVDTETFFPISKQDKFRYNSKWGKDQETIRFLIFGRWDWRKSTKEMVKTFIDTFDKKHNVQLILSVDNKDNPQDRYNTTEERLKAYGLEDDRIVIESFCSREKYIEYLQEGDVLLSCSRGEGWNLPLIEAAACGIPVIYSDCSGQLEYMKGMGNPVKISKMVKRNLGMVSKDDLGECYEPDFNDLSKVMLDVYNNYESKLTKALVEAKKINDKWDWKEASWLGGTYLSGAKKWTEEISPPYKLNLTPLYFMDSKELEPVKNNTIPWEDVFEITGKDAYQWGDTTNGNPAVLGKERGSYYAGFGVKMNDNVMNMLPMFTEDQLEVDVKIYDMDESNKTPHLTGKIKPGIYLRADREWFTNWRVEFFYEGVLIYEYIYNLEGKKVLVFIGSSGLGDAFAWTPPVEEFRRKHKCEVVCCTGFIDIFERVYPEIEFIEMGQDHPDCHDSFAIGWMSNRELGGLDHERAPWCYMRMDDVGEFPNPTQPLNYQKNPLQSVSFGQLGLEYKKTITPIKFLPKRKRMVKERYVTICSQSTTQAKYWNYGWNGSDLHEAPGWHEVVKYLGEELGYRVVVINQYLQYGTNLSDDEDEEIRMGHFNHGDMKIFNRHDFSRYTYVYDKTNEYVYIDDRMQDLKYAEFHIGLNSGMSWVCESIGTPSIIIHGLHKPSIVPLGNEVVYNDDENVCTDCASEYPFVRGNWSNCPIHYDNPRRRFECTRTITPRMVMDKIDKLMIDLELTPPKSDDGWTEAEE